MAVTFRNATALIGSGTSPTGTEPSGTASGDVLVAFIEVDTADVTAPAGWTNLVGGQVTQATTRFLVSYIVRGGSAPSLVWTFTGSVFRELHIIGLQTSGGTITLDSQSAAGGKGTDGASTTQPNPPATVASASSSLSVCGGNQTIAAAIGAAVAPSGYTLRSLNTAAVDTAMATKALSASGSEDPGAFSGFSAGGTHDWWHGFTATFTDVAASSDTQEWRGTYPPARRTGTVNITY